MSAAQKKYTDMPGRVLIVDDNEQQRALEKAVLNNSQYSVLEATNGTDAINILRRLDVDAVLLDKNMPGMNGYEVCKYIRNDLGKSSLPIIILTGDSEQDELVDCLNAGATDLIQKPYNYKELLARLESAVNSKRLTDQLDGAESV